MAPRHSWECSPNVGPNATNQVVTVVSCNGVCNAGTNATLELKLVDEYDNVGYATASDLSVKYRLLPDGFVTLADTVQLMPGKANVTGYRAKAMLSVVGTYEVTATYKGTALCASGVTPRAF